MNVEAALVVLPPSLRRVVRYNIPPGLDAVEARCDLSDERKLLSAIANAENSRQEFLATLDLGSQSSSGRVRSLVVVGGGPVAAVLVANSGYCNTDQIVLSGDFGGSFASPEPYFRMNSRNMPGESGKPGERASLNHLPGCRFQASDINADEYQLNTDFAFAVASNIACDAFRRKCTVKEIEEKDGRFIVSSGGWNTVAKKVVIATGLGKPREMENTILPSELPSLGKLPERVAVIGDGDTGKITVEYLTCQKVSRLGTSRVKRIDWYGKQECGGSNEWLTNARPRYAGIATLLPSEDDGREYVLAPQFSKARSVTEEGLVIDEANLPNGPYDLVVNCTGYEEGSSFFEGDPRENVYGKNGDVIARKLVGKEVYIAGVAARIPFTVAEKTRVKINLGDENNVAMWRYLPKAQELAKTYL